LAENPVEIVAEMDQKNAKTGTGERIAPSPVRANISFAIRDFSRMPKSLCSDAPATLGSGGFSTRASAWEGET
jgi:hypothetical protein